MTRILSYNILVGGAGRVDALQRMIGSVQPDVVGLVEAIDERVVKKLAEELGMEYRMSGVLERERNWQVAVLSRLPITRVEAHMSPEALTKPVLEVGIEEEDGQELTVFITHLASSFTEGRGGDSIRRQEVKEILRIMGRTQGPRLLMGDFNALAPGDRLKASELLRYLLERDKWRAKDPVGSDGHPYLNFVVPPALRFLNPLLRMIPRSRLLCALFDEAGTLYAPRGSLRMLLKAGYIDCFRYVRPQENGFTCPAGAPAGRIDYIIASPELAGRLTDCRVVTRADGVNGSKASDHLPVLAEFGQRVTGIENDEFLEMQKV